MDLKPSFFTCFPWDSRSKNTEAEQVAQNMMIIRKRLGDEWPLTWEQYQQERERDDGEGCAYGEQAYFKKLVEQIPDSIGAISFSLSWAEAARDAT